MDIEGIKMQSFNKSYSPDVRDAPGVIMIVLDGCRPDGLQNARVPNIDWIMENGAYTLKAQTILPPLHFLVTCPCFSG